MVKRRISGVKMEKRANLGGGCNQFIMNKTVIFCLIVFLTFVALQELSAQTQAAAIMSGDVQQPLSIVNIDGDWGTFAPGNTYVMTPGGFKSPPGPGEPIDAMVEALGYTVIGNPGEKVLLSLIIPDRLISEDNGAALPTSNWTYGWNYANDPEETFNQTGPINPDGIQLVIGGDGITGVFIGATVMVPTYTSAGDYFGQVIGRVSHTAN